MGTNKSQFNKTIAEKKRKSLVRRPRGRPPKQIVIEKEIFTMDYIKKVDKLSLEGNIAENYRIFKQNYNIFATAIEISKKTDEVKIAILLNTIGPDAVEVYNTFVLPEEEAAKYDAVVKAFDEFCLPKRNEVYEAFIFYNRNQQQNEPFDNFLMDVKKLVKNCNFNDQDRMLRDRIVMGILDKGLQKRMLECDKLDLQKATDMARIAEQTKKQMEYMHKPETSSTLDALSQSKVKYNYLDKSTSKKQNYSQNKIKNNSNNFNSFAKDANTQNSNKSENFLGRINNCKYCKLNHMPKKCPAFGKQCLNCGKLNHYAVACNVKKVKSINFSNKADNFTISEITGKSFLSYHNRKNSWIQTID